MKRNLGGCDMKRFTWWRMEQNAPHNARERWSASCSILHHVKRFMSHLPKSYNCVGYLNVNQKLIMRRVTTYDKMHGSRPAGIS